MLNLFLPRSTPSQGVIRPTKERELQTRADSINISLTKYFDQSSFRLPNNHLLVQIVKNLEYSLETPFEQVVEKVYSRAPYVANHFNLTSQLSYGQSHKRVFYSSSNNDVVDFIFSNSTIDIDPFDEDRSWVDLSPLKVIHHPYTHLNPLIPNGELKTPMKGYSVVHVDIPLLALQYREFCIEKLKKFESDAIYNANKFIVTRVLPKMLKSHMNYALFNMFRAKQGLVKLTDLKDWLPIALPDNHGLGLNIVGEIYKKLHKSRRPYFQALQSYPLVFGKDPLEEFALPIFIPTRQLNWIQILSRLPMIQSLIDLQGRQGLEINRGYIGELKNSIDYFMNSKDYNVIKDLEIRENLLETLDRMKHY